MKSVPTFITRRSYPCTYTRTCM